MDFINSHNLDIKRFIQQIEMYTSHQCDASGNSFFIKFRIRLIKLQPEVFPKYSHRRNQWNLMSKWSFVQQFTLYLTVPVFFSLEGINTEKQYHHRRQLQQMCGLSNQSMVITMLKMDHIHFCKVTNLLFYNHWNQCVCDVCKQLAHQNHYCTT